MGGGRPGLQEVEMPVVYGMGKGDGVQVYRKVRYRWCMARWGGGRSRCTGSMGGGGGRKKRG